MILSVPWMTMMVAFPAVAAVWLLARPVRSPRALAVATATTVLVAAFVVAAIQRGHGGAVFDPLQISLFGAEHALFAIDVLNGPLVPFVALVAWMLLLVAPRNVADRATLASVLTTEAALLAFFVTTDVVILGALWGVVLLPTVGVLMRSTATRGAARAIALYMGGSWLAFVVGVAVLVWIASTAGIARPTEIASLHAIVLPTWPRHGILAVLLFAVLVREAMLPLHSWMPLLFERGPFGTIALVVAPQVGSYALIRFVLPVFPHGLEEMLPLLADVGVVTAVYGAGLGLVQDELRRAVGFLAMSQSALVLVGLECSGALGIAGGLLVVVSVGTAMTGLVVVIWAIESRVGTARLDGWGGLAQDAPRLATMYLVFGLAAVGLPGTLGFIGEDVLVHGVLESYPQVGVAVVFATALNAITVVRSYLRLFCGPRKNQSIVAADLLVRERLALLVPLGLLIFLGLAPGPSVASRMRAAEHVLATEHPLQREGGLPPDTDVPVNQSREIRE